jgi:hypothetical protein
MGFLSLAVRRMQAPPRQESAPVRGAAPTPATVAVEKVVVVDQAPPPQAASRLQAQRPLAPLQVTTQAPPPPMTVASGAVEPPPQLAAYQPVMQPPQQVGGEGDVHAQLLDSLFVVVYTYA